MKRLAIQLATITAALLLTSGAAYGASPPIRSHTVAGPPSWAGHAATPPAQAWSPVLGLASATAGTGVVQGYVYDYDGSPVAGAKVRVSDVDDQFNVLWYQDATSDANGLCSVSGAPATVHGAIYVTTADGEVWGETELAFADPGPTTYDLRPGRVTWRVERARSEPWWSGWRNLGIEVVGASATGTPVYAQTLKNGVSSTAVPVTGWASALPADARLMALNFWSNEIALWAEDDPMWMDGEPGSDPIPVASGGTSVLPLLHEDIAYRISFTNSWWYSGKPGTVLRLEMDNFPKGKTVRFTGASEGPGGVTTTWGDKSWLSPGPGQYAVNLAVPATATPGYDFDVSAYDPTLRYGIYILNLTDYFQVCTLKATKTSVRRGAAVKLSGVVPVQGHEGATAGKAKYVWIYKRTTVASAPPKTWDATTKGWKLVARVRTDGYGRYHSAWLKPTRTTWYVARYAGDDWYWRAYTSVVKVRVY